MIPTIDPQLAILLFLALFIISRLFAHRAVAQLDADQRVRVVDSMGVQRIVAPVLILVLVGAFFLAAKLWPERARELKAAFFVSALVLIAVALVITQRRVRTLALPNGYIRLITIAQFVQLLAAVMLLGSLAMRRL